MITEIACPVALYLRSPEIHIGLWKTKISAAFMSVPETTVDKDACTVFTKDDIWMAGQSTVIETITETPGMQPAADNHLRPGIG